MPGSALCSDVVSLPVLTIAEQSNGNAGGSSVSVTMEQFQQALMDANANNKRNCDALDEHGQQSEDSLAQLGNLKQLFKATQAGLSEEAKKACSAPQESSARAISRID